MEAFELLMTLLDEVANSPGEFEARVTYGPLVRMGRPPGPRRFVITVLKGSDGYEMACGGGSSLTEAAQDILDILEERLEEYQYDIPESMRNQLPKPAEKG